MGLVPMISLARKTGTPHKYMEAICNLGMCLMETDFYSEGRPLSCVFREKLGLYQSETWSLT